MEDGVFSHLLEEIAKSTPPEHIKSELERRVNTINTALDDDFSRVKYEICLRGDSVLSTAQERFYFTSLLHARSINSLKAFVAYVIPSIVQKLGTKEKIIGESLSETTLLPASNDKP